MQASLKKKLIILSSVSGGLLLLLLIMLWVRTLSPAFSEWVCRYIARPWIYVFGHISSIFPFTIYEFCLIALILGGITLIVLAIIGLVHKRGYKVLTGLFAVVIFVLSALNVYTLIAGFSYYRPAAPVPESEREYESREVTEMVRYFLDDYNSLAEKVVRDKAGNAVSPYTLDELSGVLQKEYARLGGDYYYAYTPRAKGILNSWAMTLNNITGCAFLPFGEPGVNRQTPPSDLPQTMAHEMAHTKGVMREGEANFVSYYLLLTSKDDYLRYCGYFSIFYSLLPAVNADSSVKDDYREIVDSISPLIRTETANSVKFWTEKSKQPGFAGFINRVSEKIGDFMNDLFLKSNGADNGSGSYSDKVSDGGAQEDYTDPDTGEVHYDVTYSSVQKMFFAIYSSLL